VTEPIPFPSFGKKLDLRTTRPDEAPADQVDDEVLSARRTDPGHLFQTLRRTVAAGAAATARILFMIVPSPLVFLSPRRR